MHRIAMSSSEMASTHCVYFCTTLCPFLVNSLEFQLLGATTNFIYLFLDVPVEFNLANNTHMASNELIIALIGN